MTETEVRILVGNMINDYTRVLMPIIENMIKDAITAIERNNDYKFRGM